MIRESLEHLKNQQKTLEKRIEKAVGADKENARKIEICQSVDSIGKVTTAAILSDLPELGQLNRAEIAKLVGIAPINRDSGTKNRKRLTQGGRSYIRKVLYMTTLVATRRNPVIKAYYQHLLSKGKLKKVALVAAMRKLITTLNYLVKTDQLWVTPDSFKQERGAA